jgi:hypothetical protein
VRTGIIERSRLRSLHADDVAALMRLTAIEPAVAAARMLAAMWRGRPVVIPNHDVRLMYLLYRLWPRGFDALVGRLAFRAYERQRRAPVGVPT